MRNRLRNNTTLYMNEDIPDCKISKSCDYNTGKANQIGMESERQSQEKRKTMRIKCPDV